MSFTLTSTYFTLTKYMSSITSTRTVTACGSTGRATGCDVDTTTLLVSRDLLFQTEVGTINQVIFNFYGYKLNR
jgi:hypothetical protein